MATCDDRQLTEAQRQAAITQNQRAGVIQAVRPFTGSPTAQNLVDYINRELFPAIKQTRGKLNEVFRQVTDNAPSGNPLQFYFSTETAAADPTAGRLRLNSATQNAATVVRVSQDNARLADVAPWLDVMSGGATSPLGVITLTDAIDPRRFLRFDLTSMTDQGAYWDLAVAAVESSHTNPFVDDGPIAVSFIPGVGGVTPAAVPPTSVGPSPGLSLLGRSASTTGAMAAITATARRQVPSTGTAGTSVAWGVLGTIMPNAPIYDVMAPPYNATGNGVADDTTAIQAAITAAGSTGGIVALGRAHLITSTLVISGDGIWVKGRGIHPNNGSKITFNGSGSSCKAVQILGFQHSGISDCYIEAAKVYTADALLEFDGTFRGFAVNVSLTNGYNAIHVYRSTETWVSWFQIRNPFGTRGVLFDGTNAVHSYRCILETAGMDCPYPFGISGHGAAWSAGQAVVQGNIRHNTDGIWSCSQAGTTSGAGTGPAKSSIATTNPTTYRATDVTDGTAKWRWVCDRNLTWVALDSYASTLTMSKLALISGGIGVRHSNTTGGASARGDGIIATDLEIDHAYDFGIFLEDGYDAQFHSGTVTSTQFDAGIRVGGGYGVDWSIEGMRIFGNAKSGVSLAAGYGKIANNRIGHNGTLTSNTYDGIAIDGGVGNFDITDNIVGELGYTGNAQRTGIQINGSTGDNYVVVGNVCVGNLTNPIFNGPGVARTRVVKANDPDEGGMRTRKNSTGTVFERGRFNLIEGTGITLTVADDSVNDEVDITVASSVTGLTDGDKGDITVSSSGAVFTIDAATVTPLKLAEGEHVLSGAGPHNDVAIADTVTTVRVDTTSTITGFAGGWKDRAIDIIANGSVTVTLAHNTTSSAGNQITCPSGVNYVQLRGAARLRYDTAPATDVWRVVSTANPSTGRLIARTFYLSGSGTHTYNAATTRAVVRMKGGGAGGGGTVSSGVAAGAAAGGGGGAGADLELDITTVPASSAYAVGAGGTASAGAVGGDGGDTTFNDGAGTRTAPGGSGGQSALMGTTSGTGNGGDGGTAPSSTGSFATWSGKGAEGEPGLYFSLDGAEFGDGGNGGVGYQGSGGGRGRGSSAGSGAGTAGSGPGSGGGGAYGEATTTQYAGGVGKAGIVIVEEYS